ncbi:hypothetical protein [Hydrogenophaga sp.]|uniref:hypothetical protein n=1 Tax=Hydrogenophaga sp. TaxID=1904254 RepID=UPI002719C5FE|nr:hypothetical protein [Hydrogenophaga sp.]MDO9438332.1 hypothetical protein [Hydrogenophaga sp.]
MANDVKRSWLSDGKPALVQNIDLRGTILAKAVGATTTTTTTTTTTSTTTTTGTTLAAPAGQATAAVGTEITIATAPERGAVSVIRLLQPSTRAWHKTLLTEALGMVKHPERVPEATREVQRTAMKALSRLLQGKPLNFAAMTTASQQSFADTLVQLKQWKLLRHLVPTHDRWEFNVTSPQIATGLASMAPWPSTTSTLCVTLSPTLAPQSIQEVGALFKTVPANRRRLSVWASAHSHASCWTALAALVNASPPSALSIKPTTENPASLQTIREFLSQALCDELGELCLLGIQEDNLKTIAGLVSVVGTSSLDKLELPACNDSLVEALAVCKPWASLGLDASPPVAAALKNKLVVTRALNLKIQTTNSVEKQAQQNTCILDIIGAAEKSVQRLRLWGAGIDLVDMVQILDRSRFITDVAFLPTKTSPEAGKSALVLLRQNLFIRSMTSSHSDFKLALDLALRRELNQVPLRNQHLSIQRGDAGPEEFSIGAVRGLASQWGGIPEDLAALIAPLLDGKSAQSLSVVNKATFIGSRQLWETGARRLTRVFVPAAKNTAAVAGLVPTPSKRNPFVLLVEDLLNMQVPYALISDALGRRIQELLPKSSAELEANPVLALEPALTQEELDTLPQLLEAMAYAGGMPPQLWLQKAVGINLKAA